jgi:hypothetical protein
MPGIRRQNQGWGFYFPAGISDFLHEFISQLRQGLSARGRSAGASLREIRAD